MSMAATTPAAGMTIDAPASTAAAAATETAISAPTAAAAAASTDAVTHRTAATAAITPTSTPASIRNGPRRTVVRRLRSYKYRTFGRSARPGRPSVLAAASYEELLVCSSNSVPGDTAASHDQRPRRRVDDSVNRPTPPLVHYSIMRSTYDHCAFLGIVVRIIVAVIVAVVFVVLGCCWPARIVIGGHCIEKIRLFDEIAILVWKIDTTL